MKQQLNLLINKKPVVAFVAKSHEAFGKLFMFKIEAFSYTVFECLKWLGAKAVLRLGSDNNNRFSGYITGIRFLDFHLHGGYYVNLTLNLGITLQQYAGGARVFINHSIPQILRKLLEEVDLFYVSVQFHLTREHKIYPFIHQLMDERNFDFINRMMAMAGIDWFSKTDENQQEVICFFDQNQSELPEGKINAIPPFMIGHIECGKDFAHLNSHGNYKVRFLFDLSASFKTEASDWVRRVQIYGGSLSQRDFSVGLHAPLYSGAEVLLSFSENNINEIFIMGCLPNSCNRNLILNQNWEGYFRTRSDNQFIIKNEDGQVKIQLGTYKILNYLALEVKDEQHHKAVLESKFGCLKLWGQESIKLNVIKDVDEFISCEKTDKTKETYDVHTEQGNLCFKAKHEFQIQAKRIKFESGGDFFYQAGSNWVTQGNKFFFRTESGDIFFDIKKEKSFIKARKFEVVGNGNGNIEWRQDNGSGFRIDKDGNITLLGRFIVIEGEYIDLRGIIDSQCVQKS